MPGPVPHTARPGFDAFQSITGRASSTAVPTCPKVAKGRPQAGFLNPGLLGFWPRGAHPRGLQQVCVHSLLHRADAGLLAEVVRAQQAEVVVRVAVVQGQNQVDQRLAAARAASLSPPHGSAFCSRNCMPDREVQGIARLLPCRTAGAARACPACAEQPGTKWPNNCTASCKGNP